MFLTAINLVRQARDTSNRLAPRSVVEYEQHGKPILAALKEERRNKWLVVNERGQELELPPDRLTLLPGAVPGDRSGNTAVGEFLSAEIERAAELAAGVNLEEVWDVLSASTSEIPVKEFVELLFQSDSLRNHVAVRRALLQDEIFFKRKKTGFEPRSATAVEELKVKAAVEAKRAREREDLKAAMVARARGEKVELPAGVLALERFAAEGSSAEHAKESLLLIDEARKDLGLPSTGRPEERAFELLVRAGHFFPDQDLNLIRSRRGVLFSPELEAEATRLVSRLAWEKDSSYSRPNYSAVFAIDSATTRDVDDAISLEALPGKYRVGIHISDVDAIIPEESLLMKEILARGTSVYTPDYQIPMLPRTLSEDGVSLLQGKTRPVMSFLVDISESGEILDRKVERAVINISRQLTYDEVDAVLYDEGSGSPEIAEPLRRLWEIVCDLEAKRIERGAIQFSRRELTPVIGMNGRITLEEQGEETAARRLVSELMILANETAALFAKANRLPIIFRSQEKPDVVIADQGLDVPEGPAREYLQRGCLKRSLVGTEPLPHAALGVDAYTQMTSPIRRAADFLGQRQISSFLRTGAPVYSAEKLVEIMGGVEPSLDEAVQIQRSRNKYWLLKYLVQENIREIDAVIVRVDTPKPLAELEVIYSLFQFHQKKGVAEGRARLGERIRLRVDDINPQREILVLGEI